VENLIAVYVTYAIKEHTLRNGKKYMPGDIVNAEMKIKGFAPKVADRQRDEWQSVLRFSMKTGDRSFTISTIGSGKVVGNKIMIGDRVILEEDVTNSTVYVPKIEDIEDDVDVNDVGAA
jgi:hypothetical protein